MARSIGMDLESPKPVYRGVILFLYPGATTHELKTYTTADGTEHLYHTGSAYGPYGTRGPATAKVTTALNDHEEWVKRGHYTTKRVYNSATRSYDTFMSGTVPSVVSFVEEQIPSWSLIPSTVRER